MRLTVPEMLTYLAHANRIIKRRNAERDGRG